MKFKRTVGISFSLLVATVPVAAAYDAESTEDDTTGSSGVVSSMDAQGNPFGTSGAYARNAEYCLEQGYVDRAIKLCQLALQVKDDPDLHQIYAEALQKKLEGEEERDPTLYRNCVSQWLIVLRQSGGEENLAFHGLNVPGSGKFWEDDDRSVPAKQHILKLTGRLPKVWETNEKFLKRVTGNSNSTLSGEVLQGSAGKFSKVKARNEKQSRESD